MNLTPAHLVLGIIALWLLLQLKPWGWKLPARASPQCKPKPGGITVGGEFLDWPTLCQGIFLLGQPNSGKSHLLLKIMEQTAGKAAAAATTTKPNDWADYLGAYKAKGLGDSCIRLGLGSPWKLDVGEFFTKTLPGGSARVLAHILSKTGEILGNSGGGQGSEPFWALLIADTLYFSTQLAILATGRARLDTIARIINTLPNSPQEVADDGYYTDKFCGQMLIKAKANRSPADERIYGQVVEFIAGRIAGIGDKARAAAVQGAGSCIGSLLAEFGDQVCTGSNISPAMAEEKKLGVIIDGCPLRNHDAGRAFNFLNAAAFQMWALARDPDTVDTPICLYRDEIGWGLNLSHDAPIQAVSRGMKLASIAAGQNIPVIAGGMGGSERARLEAESFASMHNLKCMFANSEPTTVEWCSKIIGDQLQTFMSTNGGHGGAEGGDLMDMAMGVRSACFSTSTHYERRVRPHQFSELKTGQCYLHREGRHRLVDLWEKR